MAFFFQGSKRRIGPELAEVIAEYASEYHLKGYCEPFAGAGALLKHIPEQFRAHGVETPGFRYLAGDRNEYLVRVLQALQRGWRPKKKTCSKEEYENYKSSSSLDAIFYGYACSFRGDFRAGFHDRNNVAHQVEGAIETGERIRGVQLSAGEYTQFSDLRQFCLVLDPPYAGTKNNYHVKDKRNSHFDYDAFIAWCRKMSEHNLVFICEYSKPCREAKLVWEHGDERLYVM
jgi:site-specific DNA-adenine methylase